MNTGASGRKERREMKTLLLLVVLLGVAGCGMVNGFGSDIENAGRWLREGSQKQVDKTELKRIRSAMETQNRLINRGSGVADAIR